MKAENGRIYAQVVNGRFHWRFTAAELPEWNNDDCPAIDITDLTPQPEVGWVWNGVSFVPYQPTPGEIAAETARQQSATDKSATYADPLIAALAGMSRDEIKAHIDTVFPGLTAAQRNVLKALALAVRRLIINKAA